MPFSSQRCARKFPYSLLACKPAAAEGAAPDTAAPEAAATELQAGTSTGDGENGQELSDQAVPSPTGANNHSDTVGSDGGAGNVATTVPGNGVGGGSDGDNDGGTGGAADTGAASAGTTSNTVHGVAGVASCDIHAGMEGYLHKKGGGTTLFGRRSWKVRRLVHVRAAVAMPETVSVPLLCSTAT